MSDIHRLTVELTDDGTLDRVFNVSCSSCQTNWQTRGDAERYRSAEDITEELEEEHAQLSPDCYEIPGHVVIWVREVYGKPVTVFASRGNRTASEPVGHRSSANVFAAAAVRAALGVGARPGDSVEGI